MGRGETATSALGRDGRRSPRNRNPREAEAGSFSVQWLPTLVPVIRAVGSCRFRARAAGLRAAWPEDVISMAMVVTIGLWLTVAPAIGAIARAGKSGKKS